MAVVISPLNGLMDQHVCKHPLHSANKCQLPNLGLGSLLRGVGVTAAHLGGSCTYEDVAAGKYRFGLYYLIISDLWVN